MTGPAWNIVLVAPPEDREARYWYSFDGCVLRREPQSRTVSDALDVAKLIGVSTTEAALVDRYSDVASGKVRPASDSGRNVRRIEPTPSKSPTKSATVHSINEAAKPRASVQSARKAAIVPIHQNANEAVVVDNWEKFLHYDIRQNLTKDVGNATLIVKNAEGFKGCLKFNSMACEIFWHAIPEYKVGIEPPLAGETLADHHITYVQHVLLQLFNLSVGKDIVWSAIDKAAHECTVHPVQDYLSGLTWDGNSRVGNWLSTYLGADDTPYNAAVGKWWLISAVARAMRPGCQADHVLILEGKQGKGKSQAIQAIADPWVLGSLPDVRDQPRAADAIGGMWIVEIAELDAFKGAGMTRVKDFVTQQIDRYRPAYARATINRPRSCVFIGTTNEDTYLNDPTGARRFWPVKVKGDVKLPRLKADRDHLWAEARAMFDRGEQWHPDETNVSAILEEQEARREPLAWEAKIGTWVVENKVTWTTVDEVLSSCIRKEWAHWDKDDIKAVTDCLKNLGFKRHRETVGGKQVRGWLLDQKTD
jgi:putative DNA primase/helicase